MDESKSRKIQEDRSLILDLVAFAQEAELCPENHSNNHKPQNNPQVVMKYKSTGWNCWNIASDEGEVDNCKSGVITFMVELCFYILLLTIPM